MTHTTKRRCRCRCRSSCSDYPQIRYHKAPIPTPFKAPPPSSFFLARICTDYLRGALERNLQSKQRPNGARISWPKFLLFCFYFFLIFCCMGLPQMKCNQNAAASPLPPSLSLYLFPSLSLGDQCFCFAAAL